MKKIRDALKLEMRSYLAPPKEDFLYRFPLLVPVGRVLFYTFIVLIHYVILYYCNFIIR